MNPYIESLPNGGVKRCVLLVGKGGASVVMLGLTLEEKIVRNSNVPINLTSTRSELNERDIL